MPCACSKPEPDYPVVENWGPALWTILHALAERGGKVVAASFRDDERRQWINLIEIMPKMIPCPNCREHAEQWIRQHPITAIKTVGDSEINEWLVNWVYQFHENVNERNGKPSFDKDLLSQTYGNISIKGMLKALKPFIELAIRLSGLTLFPWNKWNGYVIMLCSFYGI